MAMEEASCGADFPGYESSIPMLRADFTRFTSKSARSTFDPTYQLFARHLPHHATYPVMNPERGPLLQLLQEIDRVVLPINDQACWGSRHLGGISLQQFDHHDRRTWRRPGLYQEAMQTWHILVDFYHALWIPAGKSEQAILERFIESQLLPPLFHSRLIAPSGYDNGRPSLVPSHINLPLHPLRPACSKSLFPCRTRSMLVVNDLCSHAKDGIYGSRCYHRIGNWYHTCVTKM